MGCKYWECKYNTQKGKLNDCHKPNGLNIIHPCPNPTHIGDYCPDGESRDTDKITELRQKI